MNNWSKDNQQDITKAKVTREESAIQPTTWSPEPETGIKQGPAIANPASGAPLLIKLRTGEPIHESHTGLRSGGNLTHE
jgi:hypothetical protein